MAEEQRCHIEGHRLCANNCGLFGNPATLNLCSKCYHNLHPDDGKSPLSLSPASSPSSSPAATSLDPSPGSSAVRSQAEEEVTAPQQRPQGSSRCAGCKRKVGITGLKCRCGSTFCGAHRYPEKHACGYDYKAKGREEIARANPVVKAEKLRKI